ncbi:MAG: cell division protein FtsZ [Candidatus Magasanikbacteria bacterium RIFOXYA2_FULL_44_8]|uniref:Cell division protein FtsZ n=1 Tax=Candidatus Magasanikbacteria bacterium RIFOXYA2_FULL_44_8 TaxID=1798696 RepID=A0A1F6NK43_9BACT|nr:MAG: cell division protein FtsZ [Candidatus Magasanikbacteria bacterium RIFOXYA2_FULL_44_8]
MPQVKPEMETFAKIKVVGVGGSGGAVVNRMMAGRIRGVEFVVMNTDVQALHHNSAPTKLHIGKSITRGLGAGMDPEVGRKAAEESESEIRDLLKDTDMVFLACGLGGGTGSGASPIVAEIAKELGALTVAIVTKPFNFEGAKRREIADAAWEQLAQKVDTIITIPNDRILQVIDKKTPLLDAFKKIDDVLRQGVQGISELITIPGLINVDFADVKAIMKDAGSALMGIGTGTGENRAMDAAKMAISSPLLELSIDGARGILFTIAGGPDMTMDEVSEAARVITSSADTEAKIIFGSIIDETLVGSIRISVVATGFDEGRAATLSDDDRSFKYTPSTFVRKLQKEEKEEEKKFLQFTSHRTQPNTVQSAPMRSIKDDRPNSVPVAPTNNDKDELEIPAFIRKKMGM